MYAHVKMLKNGLKFGLALAIVAVFAHAIETNESDIIVNVCEPEDFDNDEYCILSCNWPNQEDTLEKWSWQYYGDNENKSVYIFNNIDLNTDDGFTITLNLTTYNAGFYRCNFTINSTSYFNDFQIDDSIRGENLTQPCINSTGCMALDAICYDEDDVETNGTCHCPTNYIKFSSNIDTPACLEMQDPGESCNIKNQCSRTNESYDCVNYNCTCTGQYTSIHSQNGAIMCIAPVYLMDECFFDEQCWIYADNSWCSPLDYYTCACLSGYIMDMTTTNKEDYYCYTHDIITVGAIIGVSVGCVASVSLMGIVVFYFVVKVD